MGSIVGENTIVASVQIVGSNGEVAVVVKSMGVVQQPTECPGSDLVARVITSGIRQAVAEGP